MSEIVNRILEYLKTQTFDKVMAFIVVAMSASYVVYIEPLRVTQIQQGYIELNQRQEEKQKLRDEMQAGQIAQLEKQLQRLNESLEKRDEANAKLLNSLLERMK